MKLFYDVLPIILFFAAYKFYGIYTATAVVIVAVALQVITTLIRKQKPDLMQMITLGMVLVLGGSTLIFKNEMFIKWKPTAVYWILGLAFALSEWFGEKNLVEKMLSKSLTLPNKAWTTLNISWVCFFIIMGFVNLVVAYYFDTDTWVNFKLFGILGFTAVFVLIQGIIVSRHLPKNGNNGSV